MIFERGRRIRFADVDPAGIVFYPRYFEMINEIIEDWFDQALGLNFAVMTAQEGRGVPVAHIETEFLSPSRLYEQLGFELSVETIGRSSATLNIIGRQGVEIRLKATVVIVHIDLASHTSSPWSEALKVKMQEYVRR